MIREYLYYNVFKVLRAGIVERESSKKYSLDNYEMAQLYVLSLQMPQLITFTTDGTEVWDVWFNAGETDPEISNDFAKEVYTLVTDTTSENAYVKKYVEELHKLLNKLLQDNSDESRRYFAIMCSNPDIAKPNLKHKVVDAINYYIEGFTTSACNLLHYFFDAVREEWHTGASVSHTSAVLNILRRSKPYLKVYNRISPRFIMAADDDKTEAWDKLCSLIKEAVHTSDDFIISLSDELKELDYNYGVLVHSNTNNRFSTIVRNTEMGMTFLVSVGWPEDI